MITTSSSVPYFFAQTIDASNCSSSKTFNVPGSIASKSEMIKDIDSGNAVESEKCQEAYWGKIKYTLNKFLHHCHEIPSATLPLVESIDENDDKKVFDTQFGKRNAYNCSQTENNYDYTQKSVNEPIEIHLDSGKFTQACLIEPSANSIRISFRFKVDNDAVPSTISKNFSYNIVSSLNNTEMCVSSSVSPNHSDLLSGSTLYRIANNTKLSSNSFHVNKADKERLKKILLSNICRYVSINCDNVDIIRRIPVHRYDISFVILPRHIKLLGLENIFQIVREILRKVECKVKEGEDAITVFSAKTGNEFLENVLLKISRHPFLLLPTEYHKFCKDNLEATYIPNKPVVQLKSVQ